MCEGTKMPVVIYRRMRTILSGSEKLVDYNDVVSAFTYWLPLIWTLGIRENEHLIE